MRLIDADAFRERIDYVYPFTKEGQKHAMFDVAKSSLLFALNTMPTIEEERKKGHWIGIDDFPHEMWECDQCGKTIEDDDRIDDWKFCPSCGARMDVNRNE